MGVGLRLRDNSVPAGFTIEALIEHETLPKLEKLLKSAPGKMEELEERGDHYRVVVVKLGHED